MGNLGGDRAIHYNSSTLFCSSSATSLVHVCNHPWQSPLDREIPALGVPRLAAFPKMFRLLLSVTNLQAELLCEWRDGLLARALRAED